MLRKRSGSGIVCCGDEVTKTYQGVMIILRQRLGVLTDLRISSLDISMEANYLVWVVAKEIFLCSKHLIDGPDSHLDRAICVGKQLDNYKILPLLGKEAPVAIQVLIDEFGNILLATQTREEDNAPKRKSFDVRWFHEDYKHCFQGKLPSNEEEHGELGITLYFLFLKEKTRTIHCPQCRKGVNDHVCCGRDHNW